MNHVEYVKNKNVFLISLFFRQLAITFPHALLTLIFLSKGLIYSQIAVIQAFFSIAVIVFEFPSGVLADKYPKKIIYIISNFALIGTYFFVLKFNSFSAMILAWFIYGISSALETGTIDAEIIIEIKKEGNSSKLEQFIGKAQRIGSISAIFGSIFGFVLYQFIDVNIYIIMSFFLCISILNVSLFFKSDNSIKNINTKNSLHKIVKNAFIELKTSNNLKFCIILLCFLQIFMQIHFQLWQAFFIDEKYNNKLLIGFYIICQIITFFVYKTNIKNLIPKIIFFIIPLIAVSSIFLYFNNNKIIIVVSYFIPVIMIQLLQFFVSFLFNKEVKETNISSLTSLTSTIMRIFSALTMFSSGLLLHFISVKFLYIFTSLFITTISVIGVFFLFVKNKFLNKEEAI